MSALRVLVVTAIAAVVGIVAYQIGLSQGLATTIPAGAAPVAYYAYPHWGFGFGFFGLLFPLLFFFLIFGALRAAWWGGRGGYGKRGWGNGRERIEELHRELHGEKPTSGDRPSSTST
ncbi:MAG TPA: hypothetical protein VGS01_15280 [Candidatus Limnocylindria bacterium]|jgi:hypothetical protein|nr:hypothetical protein [Candidatus Limnocylindria bacterium]